MNARPMTMIVLTALLALCATAQARIKLVALPERAATIIRLDNPNATLIEEERVLTLQKGLNKVDFSWKGVSIDADSIRLMPLDNPDGVTLLSVSYPPNEAALVWEISCQNNFAETVRISYLLRNIDRLVTYRAVANKAETHVDLASYLVLRNFSGEDFDLARILLNYGEAFEQGIKHEETRQMLFMQAASVPIEKIWTFDAEKTPWDPKLLDNQNVGIPTSYRIYNKADAGLGQFALWDGKARIFQDDGRGSTIFLGEDNTKIVPVGEKAELYIGDSRDIVVTQRKMRENQTNIRRNNGNNIVLYDMDIVITATIENFKDTPAVLTMKQYIDGQWKMVSVNLPYEREDARTLKFEIELPARDGDKPGVVELNMHYQQLNITSAIPTPRRSR